MKNVAAMVKRWKDGMSNAAAKMKEGVEAVTESPMEKAAANVQKYEQGVRDAVNSGRYERGLRGTSLGDWKKAMTGKGASNMATGVRDLTPQRERALSELLTYTQSVAAEISSMPNTTEADAEARAIAAIRKLRAYRKNR